MIYSSNFLIMVWGTVLVSLLLAVALVVGSLAVLGTFRWA